MKSIIINLIRSLQKSSFVADKNNVSHFFPQPKLNNIVELKQQWSENS